MEYNDLINALFEFGAIFGILGHIRQLIIDKKVRGIYIPSIVFFTSWGVWNVYYYPSLGQTASAVAGASLCLINIIYLGLLLKYRKN